VPAFDCPFGETGLDLGTACAENAAPSAAALAGSADKGELAISKHPEIRPAQTCLERPRIKILIDESPETRIVSFFVL
jgi:hypothetical protein